MINPSESGMMYSEAFVGVFHLLEFAGPFQVVALGESDSGLGILHLLDGFVDGRGQVAVAHAELDRDEPAVVLAVDIRGPGLVGDHVRQLRERNAVTRAVVRATGDVDQDPVDHLGIVAQARAGAAA